MDGADVWFAGVAGQSELLRSGVMSSVGLVEGCLERIARLDGRWNAFRTVFADTAVAEARAADARRAGGEDAPLLGIPVAVKEDTDVAGWPTTVGTDAVTRVAGADAEVVARLRRAGAVIVGRTRAPELCLWPFTESPSGGVTRNPWDLAFSPGGSSGGAAAAVAGGLVAAAVGSDGGGSIRLPASSTGLFGLKPARGRVSLAPHSQVWTGLSVAGPITRTVLDAALMLDVLARPVPGDTDAAAAAVLSFADAARRDPVRLRIGVALRPWPVGGRPDPAVRRAVLATARVLAGAGHQVVMRELPWVDPTAMGSFAPRYGVSAARAVADVDQPERLAASTRAVAALGRVYCPVLPAAMRYSRRVERRVNRVFDDVDVLLSPVMPRTALRIGEWAGRSWLGMSLAAQRFVGYTALWNVTGNPAASVPAGWSDRGLPLAVQVIGRPDDEVTVLGVAGQVERARPWADVRPPTAY